MKPASQLTIEQAVAKITEIRKSNNERIPDRYAKDTQLLTDVVPTGKDIHGRPVVRIEDKDIAMSFGRGVAADKASYEVWSVKCVKPFTFKLPGSAEEIIVKAGDMNYRLF